MDGGVERSCARSLRFPSRREVISRSHPCSCRTSLKVLPFGCKWSNECRMALLYLSSPFMHPIKILSFEGREKDKKKKRGTKKKRKKKNERILSKIFCTVLVMMDKKEREREKRRREEDKRGLIWSYRNSVGFIGTLPIDHWKRSKARREEIGIDIYIYIRPYATKQPTSGKRPYFYVTCILRGWSGAFRSRGGRKRMNRRVHGPPPSRIVARTSE